MAAYRFSAKMISRGDRAGGRSIVAAAAYRCAGRMRDEKYGVLHNYTSRQKGVVYTGMFLPEDAPIIPPPDTVDADAPLFDALEDCLAAMGAEERELIDAFYFKEGSHESLARERQTTPKAVESKLARVRQKLRTAILKRLHHENS